MTGDPADRRMVVLLTAGDQLRRDALAWIAAAGADPEADLVFSDEEAKDGQDSFIAFRKPDWSPALLRSVPYTLHCAAIPEGTFRRATRYAGAGEAGHYAAVLEAARSARTVIHLRLALCRRETPGYDDELRRVLDDVLARENPPGRTLPGLPRRPWRVVRESYRPEVTLVVLTSDPEVDIPERGRLALLPNLLSGLFEHSTYPRFTVLVVHDGRLTPASQRAVTAPRVRSASFRPPDGKFSFAAKANFALGLVRTREFVLLNDDLEVVSADWLEALVDCLAVPDVGVAGAHLLFPDGRTQHAGVRAAGADGPTHRFYGCAASDVDDHGPADAVRDVSAVTAAVLATRRDIVAAAGGFDERLARNYNDIDFCLRVRRLGYRVVYTPHARLVHFEHGTFGSQRTDRRELRTFRSRWREWCADDPFFPPPSGRPMAYHRPGDRATETPIASVSTGASE